ncbi:hypothetical protein X798_00593 [Onchocerca flexuosa]|uniref:Uncharacterized protein n=1 Tax=Onchocerca flexuosa TaxID=387005 RepID=A0A238C3Z0_9BILA|nr:hypothetical protein X798_00593 [Onchocerca flexuosa]
MRLFLIVITMIAINTYAQFSVQITQLSLQESEECISKQAYYDIENNYVAVISMDIKCDELLVDAFEKAIISPENLEIQIINNPQDYENILRVAKDLCHITIIHDSSITYATWLLFDCTKNGEVHKTKDGIKWPVIISLTVVGVIVCASMGICCYLAFRRNSRMRRQKQDSLSKQQTAGRNINELSGESNSIKSSSASAKKTLPDAKYESSRKNIGSTNFSRKKK